MRNRFGTDTGMQTGQSALLLSAGMSLLIGGVAMTMALVTDSRAILLDGLVNLVYFMVALLTLRVARLLALPGGEACPWGHAYFESLVNAIKGLLIPEVSVLALATPASRSQHLKVRQAG